MVCRCKSSFNRGHVSVQAVSFSGYHHPLHPSLGVRGCCRGTWRGLKRWSFQGSPKETQPFWESIQVILMKLLLSWVSEVSTVWSPTKTLAGWCLVMSSREQLETMFPTKWFEQRFCNNSGWFAPTSKETESVESNVSRSTLQLFNKNHGTATAEGD